MVPANLRAVPAAWAFDLDGCLVDGISATSLRPLARDVLERLRSSGTPVLVWSAGGAAYARRVAERVGIAELIDAFYDKIPGPDGLWTIDDFPPAHIPGTFVDDQPERVPAGARVLAVAPYIGVSEHNRGFADVLDVVLQISRSTTV